MTSKLTREQAEDTIEGLEGLISRGVQSVYLDMAIAGMRQLLDAMDSKPVGYFGRFDPDDEDLIDQCSKNVKGAFPLYRHAQQPVVSDGLVKAVAFYEQVKRENPPVETGAWKDAVDWVLKEACRSAMLAAAPQEVNGE
ncbi:hypothetical protein GHV20_009540 [Klebsiella oxytoca]|uniref:hypothetical protein n=1 Tax=Klebsiella oxytoca TaxID=571 RepID=UPI0018C7A5B3|nr:hypothetical protein [Klebsiella oxytoca]MBG2649363.1 hypothetical protein [Klebsiella oxytoca]